MRITLKQLAYFKALAEQGHFRRAAEACHVSQPALSVQVQELEKTLGAPLVERRARRLLLTPLGRDVLATAREVLDRLSDLEERARSRAGLGGSLSLGVIPTVAPYLLPDALAALRSGDIALDLAITEAKTDRLLDLLEEGALDAAILALPVERQGFLGAPLFEDRFLLAGSAAQLAPLSGVTSPEGLGENRLLLLEDGHCLTDQALAVCGRGRDNARINLGASSLATLSRLVEAGFGLTLMPEIAARAERTAAPGLCLQRFAEPQPARRIALVRRAGQAHPAEWFDRLTATLAAVGRAVLARAEAETGP